MREYDKLVRDRIPAVVRENGETPVYHVVEGDALAVRLREKLCEEATEFREEGSVDELADVLAVVDAIFAHTGLDRDEVATVRREKRAERGGFDEGIVLDAVDDDE